MGTSYGILIHNTANGRNYYNADSIIILTAYFTTLIHYENFKKLYLVSASPKQNIGTKESKMKMPMSPFPLNPTLA